MNIEKAISDAHRLRGKANQIKELMKVSIHQSLAEDEILRKANQVKLRYSLQNERNKLSYLSMVFAFAKAFQKSEGGAPVMQEFRDVSSREMKGEELDDKARDYCQKFMRGQGVNRGKINSLGARIASAADKYDALANIALFFPRLKDYKGVLNALVKDLGELDLESFKKMVNLTLIYLEAEREEV